MHRSRLPLLVIVAALAACSTHKKSDEAKALSRDSTLAARLDGSGNTDQKTDKLPYPDECGAVTIPDQPSDADKAQAATVAQQAYDAEVLGDARKARALLLRASALDWTDKTAAYHLGRISETVGDRGAAIAAYCRYLALAPTVAEGAEARERVTSLSQSPTHVAAGNVGDGSTPRRQSTANVAREGRAKPVAKSRVIARDDDALPPRAASIEGGKRSVNAVTSGAVDLPSQSKPTVAQPKVERHADSVLADGDGVAAPRPVSTVDQAPPIAPPTAPSTNPRSTSRVQTAGIGAVVGAVIGGVAGRSAKSAAIGAAAGGILGAVMPRGTRSTSRGTGSWSGRQS
jgi:hypothetical protein